MDIKENINTFDLEKIRTQFPILNQKINGNGLVYFDNAATTQKPNCVIEAISDFYKNSNANIHRGVHTLSRKATEQVEQTRKKIAKFFNVKNEQQIIFTSGTTDSINKVALGLAKNYFQSGDEIILSTLEHHSNILPWQMWAQENNGSLKIISLNENLELNNIEELVSSKTKLISITHVSNTLGTINAIEDIISRAHAHNIPVLIDAAQSAAHLAIDLQKLNPDFLVCSAHKMYGPTGIGILFLSDKWLKSLPLAQSGGGTIKTVSFEKTEYVEGALKFEPGTPNIAGIVGFGAAIDFINEIGLANLHQHECELANYAFEKLNQFEKLEIYSKQKNNIGVISFNVKNHHAYDVGTLLNNYGIAVRTGHHCTQPLMQHLGIQGTIRVSFAAYNSIEEIDFFIEKLKRVIAMLG
jgi:cysteine desulfurase/selenocysteine lyase